MLNEKIVYDPVHTLSNKPAHHFKECLFKHIPTDFYLLFGNIHRPQTLVDTICTEQLF